MKKFLLATVLLLALIVTAAGCGDDAAEAQNVVVAAMEKLYEAGSYQSDVDMQLRLDVSGPEIDEFAADIMPLELSMQASMEQTDVEDPEKIKVRMYGMSIDGTRDLIVMLAEQDGEPAATGYFADGIMRQLLKDVEFIVYEQDIYVQFGDQWYEMSAEDLADLPDSTIDAEELECLNSITYDTFGLNDPTEIYGRLFADVRKKGSEDIDGVGTTRYEASLDAAEARSFVEDYMNTYLAELEKCGMSEMPPGDELDEVLDAVNGMIDSLADQVLLEVWIDEEGYARQLRVSVELDDEAIKQVLENIEPGGAEDFEKNITSLDARLEFTTTNSRIDEDIEVARPKDAVPFTRLFEDLEETFGSSAPGSLNG
ncbi:MAG: LolA-like protein [Thermoleophilia bacterium]